jgi:hypothetical protein
MSDQVVGPFVRRWWTAVVAGLVLLGPAAAYADPPAATVVLYEVAEALRFKGPKAATSPEGLRRRLAQATLLGKDVYGQPGTIFGTAQFVIVDASSSVDLRTGVGPIQGRFDLLVDLDPNRQSLDTLAVMESARLRGTLDLTTAQQGYATVHGSWDARRSRARGTFNGVFLIPFEVYGTYYYLDLGPLPCSDGAQLPIGPSGNLVGVCRLQADEFSLGIPLTKAVVVLFAD